MYKEKAFRKYEMLHSGRKISEVYLRLFETLIIYFLLDF